MAEVLRDFLAGCPTPVAAEGVLTDSFWVGPLAFSDLPDLCKGFGHNWMSGGGGFTVFGFILEV